MRAAQAQRVWGATCDDNRGYGVKRPHNARSLRTGPATAIRSAAAGYHFTYMSLVLNSVLRDGEPAWKNALARSNDIDLQ